MFRVFVCKYTNIPVIEPIGNDKVMTPNKEYGIKTYKRLGNARRYLKRLKCLLAKVKLTD